MDRLFTFISEFTGTTNVLQVSAANEFSAVLAWTAALRQTRPFGTISVQVANEIEADLSEFPPVEIDGCTNAWCITASCRDVLMLANIVETVPRTKIAS